MEHGPTWIRTRVLPVMSRPLWTAELWAQQWARMRPCAKGRVFLAVARGGVKEGDGEGRWSGGKRVCISLLDACLGRGVRNVTRRLQAVHGCRHSAQVRHERRVGRFHLSTACVVSRTSLGESRIRV